MKCIKSRMTVGHGETAAYCDTHQCQFPFRDEEADLCRVAQLEKEIADLINDRPLMPGINFATGFLNLTPEQAERLRAAARTAMDWPSTSPAKVT